MQGATYTNPRPGQYLMYAHSHIKREVAATYSCFSLIGAYQRGKAVGSMSGEHPRLKNPFTAEVRAKQSIQRHLHTTHVLDENRTAILPRHVRYNT